MAIYNLDARDAIATLDTKKGVVTVKHEDERRASGAAVNIPVGAIRSVEWGHMPKEGKQRTDKLRFYFRDPVYNLPKKFDCGIFTAETTPQNLKFADQLADVVSETKPVEGWQQPVNAVLLEKRRKKLNVVKVLAGVLAVALVVAGIVVAVEASQKPDNASEQAALIMQNLDENTKADLFRNSLLSFGIKAKAKDSVDAAQAVCRQFDKGATFTQVGLALLMVDNDMTVQQKGQFIAASVNWWCPRHQAKLK